MRSFAHGVSAANARRKKRCQTKLAQLTGDAVAIATGDQAKRMSIAQSSQDAARPRDQLRPVLCIVSAPRAVRIFPALPRQPGGAINLIPIRRVVFLKLLEPPRDTHLLEHGQVRGCVGVVGINEGAIPIEENSFNAMFSFRGHGSSE